MTPLDAPAARLSLAMRRGRLVSSSALAAILAAAAILPPLRPLPFDACLLHRLTGLPCLTCGLTRAVCLLVRGRWSEAIAMHPAAPIAVLLIAAGCLWLGTEAALGRSIRPAWRGRLLAAFLAAGLALSTAAWAARLGAIAHQRITRQPSAGTSVAVGPIAYQR